MNTTLTPAPLKALTHLIPSRFRAEGAATWEDFLDLVDEEATAHLKQPDAQRLLRKRSKRRPQPFFDEQGSLILRVPLDSKGQLFALVDAPDWIELQGLGFNCLWVTNAACGRLYVKTHRPMAGVGSRANKLTIARLILDLGPRKQARFRNGDTLDLRRCNLDISNFSATPTSRLSRYNARQMASGGVVRRANLLADKRLSFDNGKRIAA